MEYRFAASNPAQPALFGIRYMILAKGHEPPVPAEELARRGRHVLYEVPGGGYVEIVDVLPALEADRTNLGVQVAPWLRSDLPSRRAHPGIAFEDHAPPEATVTEDALPGGPPGSVATEVVDLREGEASATVILDRSAMVMLKTSFAPRGRVSVDGVQAEP